MVTGWNSSEALWGDWGDCETPNTEGALWNRREWFDRNDPGKTDRPADFCNVPPFSTLSHDFEFEIHVHHVKKMTTKPDVYGVTIQAHTEISVMKHNYFPVLLRDAPAIQTFWYPEETIHSKLTKKPKNTPRSQMNILTFSVLLTVPSKAEIQYWIFQKCSVFYSLPEHLLQAHKAATAWCLTSQKSISLTAAGTLLPTQSETDPLKTVTISTTIMLRVGLETKKEEIWQNSLFFPPSSKNPEVLWPSVRCTRLWKNKTSLVLAFAAIKEV